MQALLALPPALLAFVALTTATTHPRAQWPYNLPATVKYHPEHEEVILRHIEAQERAAWQAPHALRKMSGGEGEKFWLHDWQSIGLPGNGSYRLRAPLALHAHDDRPSWGRLIGRSLEARAFECPVNTFSCGDSTDSCCPTGDTCFTASGGGIGCCGAGDDCDNAVFSSCDEGAGFTACQEAGGGCCIPGSQCVNGGCMISVTQTVFYTAPVTATSGSVNSTSSGDGTTLIGASYATTTTTTQSSALVCSPGFNSCPASLGGGCCTQGYACGSVACSCTSDCTTTTATAASPIPPVSVSSATTTASSTSTETSTVGAGCPTGFYMCSAYYLGGCCRVGRDCDTTDCPSTASTDVVTSGPTVVVPYTSTSFVTGSGTVTVTSGTVGEAAVCASGWYSCPASVDGGCCLEGYVCGTVSCTATASGQNDTPKIAPSQANVIGVVWSLSCLAFLAFVGMAML